MQTKEILPTSNSKQTKAQSRPETKGKLLLCGGKEWFLREVTVQYVLVTELEGYLKFHLADLVYLIQIPSRRHYNPCIFSAQMLTVTPQLLNLTNKICQTKL